MMAYDRRFSIQDYRSSSLYDINLLFLRGWATNAFLLANKNCFENGKTNLMFFNVSAFQYLFFSAPNCDGICPLKGSNCTRTKAKRNLKVKFKCPSLMP